MLNSHNRLLAFSLVFILILQVLIVTPLFAEDQTKVLEEPEVTLEQAILIVRKHFEIPETLKEFTSGFSSYDNRQTWSLSWTSTGDNYERFSAQVDAVSGEIVNINLNKPLDGEKGYKLPDLTLAKAKYIAVNKVKNLTGKKYAKLKLVENDSVIPLDLYGSPSYSFSWERTENGLAVQGNGARIQIDALTGEVLSYNLTWHNLTLPGIEKVISAQQASKAMQQNKMLELQYFLPPAIRPLVTGDGNKEQVKLVYQLEKNGLIDALTGQPLQLQENQYLAGDAYSLVRMAAGMGEQDQAKLISLTPEEKREIEKNTKLITKEEAIRVIQKWVGIPSGFSLRTMNLNTDSGLRDTKVWYFEWAAAGQERLQSITARVDAVTGELLAFNFYSPRRPLADSSQDQPAINKKEAQALAEEFLNKIQPAKFKQTKLKADNTDEAVTDAGIDISLKLQPENTSASLNYERVVNGIIFPSNGMNVTVDLFSKKITAYNLNWFNLDFPPLSQALTQTKAETAFLAVRPMVLKYVLVNNSGTVSEAKLAYQPQCDESKFSDLMDAKTGEFLDWQGKPLKTRPHSYNFTDISGHEAEKEITVLGQAGIFGEYDKVFKPAANVTAESLFRALLSINYGSAEYRSLSGDDILKKAKELGWLKEEITPARNVSRELYCKIVVRYLGLEKIAGLEDIYRTRFQDAEQSQGYIALITGLGIIKIDGEKFEPAQNVTRAETAYSIIQALRNKL